MVKRLERRSSAFAALILCLGFLTSAPAQESVRKAAVDPAVRAAHGLVRVIVRGDDARTAGIAVSRAGGRVTLPLPIVDGVAATIPASRIDDVARANAVRAITLDGPLHVMSNPPPPSNTRSVYTKATRASMAWMAGITGTGVTVALIDTGVSEVADLAGRIVPVEGNPGTLPGTTSPCINLSGESDCRDSYGHGTFLAGLIAGNGASSNGNWKGVAPNANIISLKIAGATGAADVSNVLAALQWVVSFRTQYGIRVLNLSLGTDSTQTYRTDPLNYAVERAWASGIVVVVSASNRGPGAATISKPGDDPFVITVGATDDRGTQTLNDDAVPNFSSRGPTAADGIAKPDIVAPGAHMVSLRAPGSAIDTNFPTYIDGAYRRGSGTSMSAAVVSGLAALMVQQNPLITPDRVKFAMTATARAVASRDRMAVGAGEADVWSAFNAPAGLANQGVARSDGTGSIDASRGTVQVALDNPTSTVLGGLATAQLLLWDPVGYTTGEWNGASWYGASWYGASWYGASWYGASWYGASWYGASWYGEPEGASWYGASWYGASWYGVWE
jgi:serine protease AprX